MSAAPLRPTHGVDNSALEKASALEKGEKGYRAQKKADAKKKPLLMQIVPKNCPTEMEHSALLAKLNCCLEKIIADLEKIIADAETENKIKPETENVNKILHDEKIPAKKTLNKMIGDEKTLKKILPTSEAVVKLLDGVDGVVVNQKAEVVETMGLAGCWGTLGYKCKVCRMPLEKLFLKYPENS